MKFVLLINLKLLTTAKSFLLNIAEPENVSANKHENANYCWHFHIYLQRKFHAQLSEAKKRRRGRGGGGGARGRGYVISGPGCFVTSALSTIVNSIVYSSQGVTGRLLRDCDTSWTPSFINIYLVHLFIYFLKFTSLSKVANWPLKIPTTPDRYTDYYQVSDLHDKLQVNNWTSPSRFLGGNFRVYLSIIKQNGCRCYTKLPDCSNYRATTENWGQTFGPKVRLFFLLHYASEYCSYQIIRSKTYHINLKCRDTLKPKSYF